MPQYYNPGLFPVTYSQPVMGGASYSPYMGNSFSVQTPQNYMISVDGEQAARAWQMPGNIAPGTVIPLFDVDGEHVYFKSTDAYGRLNPLRKGRVVLEETPQLPQGQSGSAAPTVQQDMSQYVTKEDLSSLEQRIMNALQNNRKQNQQVSQPGNRGGETR